MTSAPSPLLDPEHAAFVQTGVSIDLASGDRRNIPTVARAFACRVSPDRRHVTVFLGTAFNSRFLDAVADTRSIAAVFCRASTLRTIQLKGVDAAIVPLWDGDVALVERAIQAFAADVELHGFSDTVARMGMSYSPADLVALTFTPNAAFVQTPGPTAGTRI